MSPHSNEQNDEVKGTTDPSILFGRMLANPPPGEEVCITGLSGSLPNSRNVQEFRDNLMNKIDMIDGDNRRWVPFHDEIPQRGGKIYDIQKFDAGFFGIHERQAHTMDPLSRLFMEKAIDAIMDAGFSPAEFEGTRTGVFCGLCFSDTEAQIKFNERLLEPQMFHVTGFLRSMIPHRLSYFLNLKGPSLVADSACSSSFYALEHAYTAIRTGLCDMAIVGGTQLTLHPLMTLQFSRLGVLSVDGKCKSFDESANGYCRAESIICVILQKKKDARRIYSTVVHAKANCDGYKDRGITYPSGRAQSELLEEIYEESGIDPAKISYLEAHGTGTRVGDPEEVESIEKVFCKNRETPLLMGSVKSNMGHTEPASGLCSLTKCIIAMEENMIPPNLHYFNPRKEIKSLQDGSIRVVSEKMPFQDDRGLVGINSFGFGGGNCHAVLKWHTKLKGKSSGSKIALPRLLCVSGRTPEGVDTLLKSVLDKMDDEHIGLLHQVFKKNITQHPHRGYSVISEKGELLSSSKFFLTDGYTLVLAFGCFGNRWRQVVGSLLRFQRFSETITRIQHVMDTKGISISSIIEKPDIFMKHPVLYTIIGSMVLHVGIIDLLKDLKLQPDFLLGHAIGAIACGYLEETLTLEEAMLMSYEIGALLETIEEFSQQAISRRQPKGNPEFELIWDGMEGNIMKHGTSESKLSPKLTVSSSTISKIEKDLLARLKKIITKPKKRTTRWISSSSCETASAEFFVEALRCKRSYLDEDDPRKPQLLFAEMGDGIYYQKPISSKQVIKFEDQQDDISLWFFKFIGSIYEHGYNPQIQNLYPKVEFPVSRGTPMISPSIKWDHSKDWQVLYYRKGVNEKAAQDTFIMDAEEWEFAKGHVIDGRNLFPATGYLKVVWKFFANNNNFDDHELNVELEDVKFKRALTIDEKDTKFRVLIQRKSGVFEIIESDVDIVRGRIRKIQDKEVDSGMTPLVPGTLPLKKKEVYKELRLRGYNYKGAFRGIQECNCEGTHALIQWDGNWVSFMDNMLQMQILQFDSRLLYVPTGMKSVKIYPRRHLKYVETFGENPVLPVYANKDSGIIRCGGIEIHGMMTSSIPRKKQLGAPVLERHVFVANDARMKLEESIRVNMQIGLENSHTVKVKVIEVIDEAIKQGREPLGPLIFDVFADVPLINPTITVLSQENLELPNVTVENRKLQTGDDCYLIVGTNILQEKSVLPSYFSALKENGFILSRESFQFNHLKLSHDLADKIDILTVHEVGNEKLVYFRQSKTSHNFTTIEVTNEIEDSGWLTTLQSALEENRDVLLYAQGDSCNGLLGLLNCIRLEPSGMNVRCVFIDDAKAPKFDPNLPLYKNQLSKNLAVNIYKNGCWGTYRHLLIGEVEGVESEHCFVNTTVRGDLSSLKWIQGHLTSNANLGHEKTLVQVHYASLNFRDIMTASGRINVDVITTDRMEQECVQGFEFAGRDINGRRVMGMVNNGALSTMLEADKYFFIDIPENWSMEQAATVPVVYSTIIYAFEVGRMRKGDSVLIHSGTGGVGQAAIHYALAKGCIVFTSVGTPEKRELIKKMFPQIKPTRIGNSRDLSFEMMIKKETRGRGVDLVLNSLAEDKLQASIRCLAPGGRFLEIGKFDIANNNPIYLNSLMKGCSFHGIMLDQFFKAPPCMKKKIIYAITEGIRAGYIKPLASTVFKMEDVEKAFRYMATGKHTGKVLIKIRNEEKKEIVRPPTMLTRGSPRFTCDPDKSYVICGGLGGFGLELADLLILRGAKKVVLTSRKGIQNGYQTYRLKIWRSYGIIVKISTADITTEAGCQKLIEEAEDLGPVESVFNLAVVLKDSLLENQTPESFRVSFAPKAVATKYLDEITRKKCPSLKDFVIFSSVSCGRGNAGQTNYGMSNSIMERICEQRKLAGYPALAIQWGAVGDVGLVADMMEEENEMVIGGTLQQSIISCLQVMDILLRRKDETVVSSMLVAEKRIGDGSNDMVATIGAVLGVNRQTVSPHTTLSELGMDSMTAVEIKQILERDFDVFLTAQDIRNLTLHKLQEIQESKKAVVESKTEEQAKIDPLDILIRNYEKASFSTSAILRMDSLIKDDSEKAPSLFFFPGIEGFATFLLPLAAKIRAKTIGIQIDFEEPTYNYRQLATAAAKHIEGFTKPTEELNVVCYSWGSILCLEAMSILEQKGYKGTIICIDGSPDMIKAFGSQHIDFSASDAEFESQILCHIMKHKVTMDEVLKSRKKLQQLKSMADRLTEFEKILENKTTGSSKYWRCVATSYVTRLEELRAYTPDYTKLKSKIILFKPSALLVPNISEDYNLSRLSTEAVDVKTFEGNHFTILDNPVVADTVNAIIGM